MSDISILFAKPGAVRVSDRVELKKAGVIVVEVENLEDVRLVKPEREPADIPRGSLLACAGASLRGRCREGATTQAPPK